MYYRLKNTTEIINSDRNYSESESRVRSIGLPGCPSGISSAPTPKLRECSTSVTISLPSLFTIGAMGKVEEFNNLRVKKEWSRLT